MSSEIGRAQPMRIERFQPVIADVRRARLFAQRQLGASRPASERVSLLVSELATNVVLHAHTPFSIATSHNENLFRVEVHDECPSMPTHSEVETGATSGRGMFLVNKLARRWGVERRAGDGKTVWFEVNGDEH